MIDWNSSDTHILLNPRFPLEERQKIQENINELDSSASVWLRSSGTESSSRGIKMVQLTKKAILSAAQSVNQFLDISKQDKWVNPLPLFHIGGLSISARCYLCDAQELVYPEPWNPQNFVKFIAENHGTITSLVPTQIVDIVNAQLKSPESLSKVIVGGGSLSEDLWQGAQKLGWPLLPSYGMTETAAMFACAPIVALENSVFPTMELLSHMNVLEQEGKFSLSSESLFTSYLFLNDQVSKQVKRPDPFIIDDQIKVNGNVISVLGRESDLIKILGETVNIANLEERIQKILSCPVAIQIFEEKRRGFNLCLWLEGKKPIDLNELNGHLMPYESILESRNIEQFPRTELGKIKKFQLFNRGN